LGRGLVVEIWPNRVWMLIASLEDLGFSRAMAVI
jgi:hypothetical protein